MRVRVWISAPVALALAAQASLVAQAPPGISERVRGAERVVVASVSDVSASFAANEYGDQLIVSQVSLAVEESLKGQHTSSMVVEVEGGTVGDLTLEVSSLPRMTPGERAVFFVTTNRHGKFVPHLRGLGILKLDGQNRVRGSALDLAAIRQAAAAAGR
jgi:hypothetical protein